MTTPHQLKTPSGAGFSFMDLFSPKVANLISFGDQPNQADAETEEATRKKSGLEAYSRQNKQSLPSDFADQVLENEMDLEKDFVTLETVNKLTELYSLAMAFYESEGNHKYKYFANKLQDLLMKANVKEMMMRELAPAKTKNDDQQVKRLRLENKISKINAEREAFTVVKSQEYRDKELNKVLERNIQSQKDRLKQRLAEKKARSVSRAQSVTYISDDNSSVADENAQDLEKELEGVPKFDERPLLNDIAEVDETRYNTPPRKRTKDGHMIFFEKGKAQKTFKFDFDVEDRKPMKGHARRHSYHKEPVVTVLAQKRTSRAQSFGNNKNPIPIENLKPLTNEIETETDVVRKETKNQTIVEDCNEADNKSLNSVESVGKNQSEEPVAQEEVHNVESAVFLDDDEPSDHEQEEVAVEVHEVEETQVENTIAVQEVIEEVQQVANDQEEPEVQVEAEVEQVEAKEEEIKAEVEQEEEPVEAKEEEVIEAEVEQVEAKEEEIQAETNVEEQQVEPVEAQQEVIEEAQIEQVETKEEEVQAEANVEEQQVEAEVQEEVEPVEAQQEEVVEEAQIEQVETKEEEVQAEANVEEQQIEAQEEVQNEEIRVETNVEEQEVEAEVQQEEVVEENKAEQTEIKVEEVVEEETQTEQVEAKEEEEVQAEANVEEEQVQAEVQQEIEQVETKQEEIVEAETKEEEVQVEEQEIPAAVEQEKQEVVENIEEVKEQPEEVAQVQEENVESPKEKKSRTRTDSEVADEKKLELMRQIDAEQKGLMEVFMKKQEEEREEVTKKIEEKYEQKIQNMKEDMDEDEIAGDMWQRALKKFTKDKETEINEALEKLGQDQVQEYEKYKKKLLQQKMFKLAELSE